jgi:hypothetical protein
MMVENKIVYRVLIILILAFSLTWVTGECAKAFAQETDQKAFKALKEKMINPQTGLPNTLDPNLFKGKAKRAYEVDVRGRLFSPCAKAS